MNITNQGMDSSRQDTQRSVGCWLDESDTNIRLAKLEKAVLVMMDGDRKSARRWLQSRLAVLDYDTPSEHALTDRGALHVDNLISRRMNRIFS